MIIKKFEILNFYRLKIRIIELKNEIKNYESSFSAIKLNDCKAAQQNSIHPYGTYCINCDGEISLYKHSTKKEILENLSKK